MVVFDAAAPASGGPVATNTQHDFVGRGARRGREPNDPGDRRAGWTLPPTGPRADRRSTLPATGSHSQSGASNLVPGVTGTHAYVRDLSTGTTTLGRSDQQRGSPDARRERARISADGRHVAYVSSSPDAPGAPANDRTAMSTSSTSVPGLHGARGPRLGRRGRCGGRELVPGRHRRRRDPRRVRSSADNLGAGAPGGKRQIYAATHRRDDDLGVDSRRRGCRSRHRPELVDRPRR